MFPLQPHNLIDFFHRKRLGGAGKFGDQQNAQTLGRIAAGHGWQVDDRNHLTPNIGHSHDRRRRIDHDGDLGHHHDLAHLEHIDAKQLAPLRTRGLTQTKQKQLKHAVAGQIGSLVNIAHGLVHKFIRFGQWGEKIRGRQW